MVSEVQRINEFEFVVNPDKANENSPAVSRVHYAIATDSHKLLPHVSDRSSILWFPKVIHMPSIADKYIEGNKDEG